MLTCKTQLFLTFVFLIIVLSCNNKDPVGNNNTDAQDSIVADIDGNIYHTVKLGNQLWTMEDLRTTKFNNGTPIPLITDSAEWISLSTPGYCYYNNITDPATIKKYGALYNWYAVNKKNLAPVGWHIPSKAEWDELQNYLIANGYNWDNTRTGNKVAKSLAASSDWQTCNIQGTIGDDLNKNNKSNFSALPAGSRYESGVFGNRTLHTHWWSATEAIGTNAMSTYLTYDSAFVSTTHSHRRTEGFAVRIVKNK